MPPYACADLLGTSHFSHRALLDDFDARVASNHSALAILLTRIAEIDLRRLYLDEGYPSMNAFLIRRMKLPTKNSAFKRLTAARTARKYPGVLMAMFEGRLHLTGVLMLAARLTPANSDELVAAALDKTCFELEVMLAERFPQPDLPERLEALAAATPPLIWREPAGQLAARRVESTIPAQIVDGCSLELAAQRVEAPRSRVVPLAPQKFAFQFTGDQETHELYEHVRALLSNEVPTGEMALVFKATLKLTAAELAKRKFGATDRPGHSRGSADPRHIPADVKRAVRERDQARCAFVSESGRRCGSSRWLEFDHIVPVAQGGEATVENIRLLCRAHNQHAAERAFGAVFMNGKRGCRGRGASSHVRDAATGEPL